MSHPKPTYKPRLRDRLIELIVDVVEAIRRRLR